MIISNLQALHNLIIVKPIESEESTYGSIIVPDMGKETSIKGEVYVAGPGFYTNNGVLIPTTVRPGDIVYMPQMGPTKIQYKGVDYLVLRENEILAVETNRYIEPVDSEELPF
jgi:chaperonin GroES